MTHRIVIYSTLALLGILVWISLLAGSTFVDVQNKDNPTEIRRSL